MSTNTLYTPADADHGHPHWNQPRVPGRAVRRRQMRSAGKFKPRRRHRGKGRSGPTARIYQSHQTRPLIPAFLNQMPTMGRLFGGDR